ncbi:SWIM zinc finger family protein [Megasphaera sp.]|uniref:SWIM zinc finger family protein n=1 Tax=Megasphaera sp. TaxID=2023260 RepID=UPI0025C1764E|nr:SWIM zinc finger family protein [Megasphaera sp.]MCF0152908.1 SWIM zinc finger family protein [Megasphaera sp.]
MDLGNWRDFFSSKIFKRGEQYYEEGHVHNLECTKHQITADVYGRDIYEVTIDLEDGQVEAMDCTCPYAEQGSCCKHMAAVLLAAEDEELDETADAGPKEASWQDILQKLPESDLRSFVFQLAEDDRDLQKKIVLEFSKGKPSAQEMHRYEREIDRVLAPYDRLGFIEWDASKDFVDKVIDYLSSTIPPLIKRSCTMETLELVNIMAANVADISFENEDDQQLCLDECRDYWADIIDHAKPEELPKIHQWFIQQMDAVKNKENELYGYYEEVLYNDFDDTASLKWKLERLDADIEHYELTKSGPNDWNYGYTYGTNLVMRIHTMQQLGYPQTDIEQYIQGHYENRQVRDMLISDAFQKNDYQKAVKLLRDSQVIDDDKDYCQRDYSIKLIHAYQALEDDEGYKQALWEHIQHFDQNDLEQVLALKACHADEWDTLRQKILQLPSCRYLRRRFLAEEKMVDELWADLQENLSPYDIDQYADVFKDKYGNEIRDYYADYVKKTMPGLNSRNQYQACIFYLKKLSTYPEGLKMARKIAQEWRETYRKRRAMKDELSKAGF